MSRTFTVASRAALDDLQVFLARSQRVEDGSVRLIAGGGVLAIYTAVLYPIGLTDSSPTVLGLRTAAIAEQEEIDAVVPIASLLARVERAQAADGEDGYPVALPTEVHTVTWAGISPPRGGWRAVAGTDAATLDRVAREGIDEVAATLPEGAGEQLVRKVRGEVWGREIPGAEHIPAGAAFAGLSLGFLGPGEVEVFETGAWTRVSTARGHVLIRRRAWTLSR